MELGRLKFLWAAVVGGRGKGGAPLVEPGSRGRKMGKDTARALCTSALEFQPRTPLHCPCASHHHKNLSCRRVQPLYRVQACSQAIHVSPRVPELELCHLQMGHQGQVGSWTSLWPVWVQADLLGGLYCPGFLSTDWAQLGLEGPRLLRPFGGPVCLAHPLAPLREPTWPHHHMVSH